MAFASRTWTSTSPNLLSDIELALPAQVNQLNSMNIDVVPLSYPPLLSHSLRSAPTDLKKLCFAQDASDLSGGAGELTSYAASSIALPRYITLRDEEAIRLPTSPTPIPSRPSTQEVDATATITSAPAPTPPSYEALRARPSGYATIVPLPLSFSFLNAFPAYTVFGQPTLVERVKSH
ncbi:hypothetical protein BDQ17DRAFT_1428917 [Cyathus striatus]|nr:hypothetical protein BDQ17DRAFT_1428917 [Cyathus striatus]